MKNVEDLYPLSPLQQGMLFHGLLEPGSSMYFQRAHWLLEGALDPAALRRAWQETVDRHPMLRTCFVWEKAKQPLQVVRRAVRLPFDVHDLRDLDGDKQEARIAVLLDEDRDRGFDFARPPLMRVTLLRTADEAHHLVWSFHHLLLDGWSVASVLREVFGRYAEPEQFASNGGSHPVRPYRDYIAWLGEQDLDGAEAYWRRTLAGFDEPTPLGVDHPGREREPEAEPGVHRAAVPVETIEAFAARARSLGVTVNAAAQGAWALLLSRYSGRDDVVFGTTVAGRPPGLPGVEEMIGLFINTLPVRVRLDGDERVEDWLRRMQREQAELREYDFSPLAQVQGWSEVPAGTGLFESLFVFENYPVGAPAGGVGDGLRITPVDAREHTNYPLSVAVVAGEELVLDVSYDRRRLDAGTVQRLCDHYARLLDGIAGAPAARVDELGLLSPAERLRLLSDLNPPPITVTGPPLHEQVAARAAETPDAIAAVHGDDRLTYAEFDASANRLAQHLARAGVGRGDVAAVCLERSLDLPVALLAVLKAGAAYVPVDPAYPPQRLAFMLEETGAPVVLTHERLLARLPDGVATPVVLDRDAGAIDRLPAVAPDVRAAPDDLAYVIYTSGSTGRPKGVCIEHRALASYVEAARRWYGMEAADRVVQFSSITFDASVDEVFPCLASGAALLLPSAEVIASPADLLEACDAWGATVLMVPTAYWHELVASAAGSERRLPPSLRVLVFGGEQAMPSLAAAWVDIAATTGCRALNSYGATEATVGSTLLELAPEHVDAQGPRVPVGRPMANSEVYVLDRRLEPVPDGVAGEICLGGGSVAAGYLHRPGLTATRFVAHPFAGRPGDRLYRTGDLGRFRPDGTLEVLGRVDDQVKVRGFRIELGEIEAALTGCDRVREAVVAARDEGGEKRLVAYVVPDGATPTTTDLRADLRRVLPDYMVPSAFVTLDALPVTVGGKVDRRALPAPTGARPEFAEQFVPPRTEPEQVLAAVWEEVLGVDRVGANDNFFELGGDSILSIQIVARARQRGVTITPKQLFDHQTVAALAAAATDAVSVDAQQDAVEGDAPLTPIQRWFTEQPLPDAHHFNQSVLLALAPGVDAEALATAVRALGVHHDALRLRLRGDAQHFAPAEAVPELEQLETTDVETSAAELQAGLDHLAGPVARFVRLGVERLLIVVHHLAVDAVSWRILLEDLARAYEQAAAGESVDLGPKTTSFKRWAERLAEHARDDAAAAEAPFWLALGDGAPARLPLDHAGGENAVATSETITVELDEAETRALLHDVPAAYRSRINDVLLTAFARALCRWTGDAAALVDLEGHGREEIFDDVDLSRTVGWFTTTFPVVLEPGSDEPGAALKAIKEQLRAIPRNGIGYGLLRHLRGDEQLARQLDDRFPPLVSFNYLGRLDTGAPGEESTFGPAPEPAGPAIAASGRRSHLVEVNAAVSGGRLGAAWTFSRALHDAETIAAVADAFAEGLRLLIAHCTSDVAGGCTPSDFPLAGLDQASLDRLVGDGRTVEDLYPLSPLQEGMLFHTLAAPESTQYFEQVHWELSGPLDAERLGEAFQAAADRHPILRTAILLDDDGRALQVVRREARVPFDVVDLTGPAAEQRVTALLEEDRAAGFALDRAPLMRVLLIRVGEREHHFVWSFHHLLLDGWSVSTVLAEVFAAYGDPAAQPLHARPYRDYIAWLHDRGRDGAKRFWQERLAGFETPTPLGVDRQPRPDEEPGEPGSHEATVSPELTARLSEFARSRRVALNTLVQAGWALLLSHYSGERDVVFGATVSGRPPELEGVEQMIGLFINTLPVRVRIDRDEPVDAWLARLQREQTEAHQHEHSPLAQIQGWSDVGGGRPLFESLLVFENYPLAASSDDVDRPELEITAAEAREHTNYPMSVVVSPGDVLSVHLFYDRRRFDAATVERFAGHYERLLEAMVERPDASPSELSPLSAEERRRLVVEWNATGAAFSPERPVHALIGDRAGECPGAVAVSAEEGSLTFAELEARANQVAHHLLGLGVGRGSLVAVVAERSVEMVVGLLGVLKAGAAYVPLDPEYPADRLAFMLEDTDAQVVLTHERFADRFTDRKVVVLDGGWEEISRRPASDPGIAIGPDDVAYVIYTSGSTGRPKGVLIEHGGLVQRVLSLQARYPLGSEDRVLQKTPYTFDVSILDLFWPLVAGSRLVMARPGGHGDPAYLQEVCARERISVLHFVPSMLDALLEFGFDAPACLRLVFCMGEALSVRLVDRFFVVSDAELHDGYGPTEATIAMIFSACSPGMDGVSVPIGRPIANTEVYIVDDAFSPVPVGVAGELCLGGIGIARGYLNRPGLSAERFVADAFSGRPGARLYRTGDLARYRPDGTIEFLGRLDHQVKVRGFRVELGEIEAALAAHPQVHDAVVVARGAEGQQRLVAYLVGDGAAEPSSGAVREHLNQTLPEYMVPAAFVTLDRLPLNPSGKVDRLALPDPGEGRDAAVDGAYVEPRTAEERALAEVWAAVLRVERVGVHDNFFELGGDSILSIQVVTRARRAGIGTSPRELFEHPTIAQLAQVAGTADTPPAEQGPVTGDAPLTPIQRWFTEQRLADAHHFNQSVLLEVPPDLDAPALECAVAALGLQHDVLRARFHGARQAFTATAAAPALELVDAAAGVEQAAAALQASLDIEHGPIARFALVTAPGEVVRLLVVIHHLAVDAVSWSVLLDDLSRGYEQALRGEDVDLGPKTTSFKRWAELLDELAQGDALADEAAYWRALPAAPPLPVDRPGGENTVGSSRAVTVSLDPATTDRLLHGAAAAYRAQPVDLLLTAMTQALCDWSGGGAAAFALEGHGREEHLLDGVDLSRTVGWFTTLFPVVLTPADDPARALKTVKEQLRATPRGGIGYGLLRHLGPDDGLRRVLADAHPQVSFNYLGQVDASGEGLFRPAGESAGPEAAPAALRPHVLDIVAAVGEGSLGVALTYSQDLHDEETVRDLADRFAARLRVLVEHCAGPVAGGCTPSDFPLAALDQLELDRLVGNGRGVEDLYPLTPLQQGMAFHSVLDPGSGVYVQRGRWRLDGVLDGEALERAWRDTVARHPVLRSAVVTDERGRSLQLVQRSVELPFVREDLRGLDAEARAARIQALLDGDALAGFDLASPPLMRLWLLRTGDDEHELVWSFHHLLLDGWSVGAVLAEVFGRYGDPAFDRGAGGAPRRPFRDYVAWLAGRDPSETEAFWRRTLSGFDAATPLGIDRAVAPEGAEDEPGSFELALPADATARLTAFARAQRLTLNTLVQGAWALLLSRYSGGRDVVFGTTVSGRPADLDGVEQMIGLFINTLPVRVEVDQEAQVAGWLGSLQGEQAELRQFEHSALPDVQAASDVPAGQPLFESLLVFENFPIDAVRGEGGQASLSVTPLDAREHTNYPLSMAVLTGEELVCDVSYDRRRFDASAIARLARHFARLLEALAERPEARLAELSPLDEDELHQLLVEWNDTDADTAAPVLDRFAEQVARRPDAVAVAAPDGNVTYAELDASANRLAHALRDHGVGRETLVGVCLPRSVDTVVTLLAVLRAGGAYLPLDPGYPAERLAFMVADARASVLVTRGDVTVDLPVGDARVVRLDEDADAIAAQPPAPPDVDIDGGALAYVVYTSGSTGRPKGVLAEHAGLANLIDADIDAFGLSSDSSVLAYAPLSFDLSIQEILMTLCVGGRLVVAPADRLLPDGGLGELLREERITALQMPPLAWAALEPEEQPDLEAVLTGSDRVPHELVERWAGAGKRVLNVYGSTEATADSTVHVCVAGDPIPPAVGRPLANTRLYLVDADLEPVPVGVPGEICIGGAGVARGYLHRPGLTAERFVADPFSDAAGARLYRTGDLGRYRDDGTLEFLGRVDHQVKVRGFRVEVGEVERALAAHPAIDEAVVAVRGEGDRRRLVAYLVTTEAAPDVAELRAHLRTTLPDYMVPAAFVTRDALPLTPTGKIDRRALPEPGAARPRGAAELVQPRTGVESALATVWQEVLAVEPIGVEDDFFELGGDSILSMQVVARVRDAFGVDVALRELFDAPTVAGLATAVKRARRRESAAPPLVPVGRDRDLPLSFGQQRLWFIEQLQPEAATYNSAWAVRLRGELDVAALAGALDAIVARHEALRTTFAVAGGEPIQVVHPAAPAELQIHELDDLPPAERAAAAERLLAEEADRPFDLRHGPLFRALLVRLAGTEHVLVLSMHHIVSDGWTLGVLEAELSELFAAAVEARPATLEPLVVQYPDYAVWQRTWLDGEVLDAEMGYWRDELDGAPQVLELPTDRRRPAVQSLRGDVHAFRVPPDTSARLLRLGREHDATPFMTLLTAYAALLQRYSGQRDVLVGTPIAGRARTELEPLIGFFVNTVVIRSRFESDPSFAELLGRVREAALGAFAHQDVPFERLVEELVPDRSLSHSPLFQVVFTLESAGEAPARMPGLDVEPVGLPLTTTNFDLTLHLVETADGLEAAFEYSVDLFDPQTAERFGRQFVALLEAVVEAPQRPLSELSLLAAGERELVVREWAGSRVDVPARPVHALVAEQPADRVAVVFGEEQVTYGELDARANRLARHLIACGVGPESLVGLCLERSVELVAALLGVLKAGAAFVPLDPEYPRERLGWILEDCDAPVVVTQRALAARLPACDARLVVLDDDAELIAARSEVDPGVDVDADALAYVMFTSGSTGRPKGVLVEHRSILRLVRSADFARLDADEVFLQLAPVSFDASTLEIWGALANGAKLVVFPPGPPTVSELGRVIAEHGVSILWLTASLFNVAVDHDPHMLAPVRQLLIGGEVLSVAHVRKALAALPDTRIVNGYGPTENTTFTCCHPIPADLGEVGSVPIGRPIANTEVLVLDEQLQPVGVGVPGELCTSGAGLARGYLNRPALTAQTFVAHPFRPGERIYRTGDLVRWRDDGTLDYLGRIDRQIKLRGFRIELGEIQTALTQHPAVRDAAVIADGDRLVAYVTGTGLDTSRLRVDLADRLSGYMIPSLFVVLDELPLSPNGKLDYNALPKPGRAGAASYEAPRSETERVLAAVWADALGLDEVGVHDSFFDIGGHSLAVIKLLDRIEATTGVRLAVRSIFERPTIAELTSEIDARAAATAEAAADTSARVIRFGGASEGVGVVFVHPLGGSVFPYLEIARNLGDDRPLWGVQAPELDGEETTPETIEAMAAAHLAALDNAGVRPPYVLAGWSMGGLVAFEMARQLELAGRPAPLLALLDTAPPEKGDGPSDADAGELLHGPAVPAAVRDLALKQVAALGRYAAGTYRGRVALCVAAGGEAPSEADARAWDPFLRGAVTEHRFDADHMSLMTGDAARGVAAALRSEARALKLQPEYSAPSTKESS
ncbi:MAG: non-ribosomal peptide synthetase [Micrococcales bacterium]|nr:MAG: non-ribosomal peptide synthetase [Micrococcales bacterium]